MLTQYLSRQNLTKQVSHRIGCMWIDLFKCNRPRNHNFLYINYRSTCKKPDLFSQTLIIGFSGSPKINYLSGYKHSEVDFEQASETTLDSLCEYFEEIIESNEELKSGDVTYSDGVLTVFLGDNFGTYVINRQSPNKQIWLSSPLSGPKRYDFVGGLWVYKRDGKTLHSLLNAEIKSKIKSKTVDFSSRCSLGRPQN